MTLVINHVGNGPFGGGERHTCELVEGLCAFGPVTLLTDRTDLYAPRLAHTQADVLQDVPQPIARARKRFRVAREDRRRGGPMLAVLCVSIHTDPRPGDLLACKAAGYDVRTMHHNVPPPGWTRPRGLVERLGIRALAGSCITRRLCVSGPVRDHWITNMGVSPDRLVVCPNWADTDRFFADAQRRTRARGLLAQGLGRPVTDATLVTGAIGRAHPHKRPLELLDAFAEAVRTPWAQPGDTPVAAAKTQPDLVTSDAPDLVFLWIGDGPLLDEMRRKAQALGVGERTYLPGSVQEPEVWHNAFDFQTMASSHEGMPLVILEAHATGVPLIASPVGGVPEIITHNKDGLLIEVGDHDGLVRAIVALARDHTLRARLAAAALERSRMFTKAERLAKIYAELGLAQHHGQPSPTPSTH